MDKKRCLFHSTLLSRLLFLSSLAAAFHVTPADAQQGRPADGFSGFVSGIVGVASVESQFQTDSGNRITNSLNSSGDKTTVFVPIVPFELAYMKGDWSTQFYGGIPFENLREGNFFQAELGVRYWLADNTRLNAAFLAPPFLPDETWSDPFLLGQPRKETDIDALGFRLRADNIAGTHWGVRYEFVDREIDNEQSGQSLPLSAAQRQLLERDANYHRFTTTYALPLDGGWWLRPALRLTYSDAEGDANSYSAIRPELGIAYVADKYDFTLNLSYQSRWYEEANPIYGRERDSSVYRATAVFSYQQPFGWENTRFNVIGSAAYEDSDISFYDSQVLFIGSGLSYSF